jgi:uncharacterized protein (DUF433 family)
MTTDDELLKRITTDPSIMDGKPVVRGLRITIEQIVRWFAAGTSEQELLAEFPFLEPDDIRAALLYASRVTAMTRMSGEAVAKATHLEDAPAR